MNEVDTGSTGSFKFPNFLSMMLRKIDEINAEAEIREAFKVFDSVSPFSSLYDRIAPVSYIDFFHNWISEIHILNF